MWVPSCRGVDRVLDRPACTVVAGADWGPWGEWSECLCSGLRLKSRECEEYPCDGYSLEEEPCDCVPFDAEVDCIMVHKADSVYGQTGDPCDCYNFYQCDIDVNSTVFGIKRRCPDCEMWSQSDLTCVEDLSLPNCVNMVTTEGIGNCTLLAVDNEPDKFMLGGLVMDCAPGSTFNLTLCTCVYVEPQFMLKGLTCITFDMGDDSFLATHGVWLKHDFVEIEPNCGVAGNCGRFRSANRSSMQVPAFSNAFDQFSEFSVSFWFKRDAGNTGLQALINNYACNVASSVDISSTDADVVAASMRNETGSAVALLDLAAADGKWHHYVVVYTGQAVIVYLDHIKVAEEEFVGKLQRVKAPIVIGARLCKGQYFDGVMDTISFAKGALNQEHVDYLFDNGDSCLP
ncbi:hypothetical protein NP493_335g04011 [Ridgeia piscesae]|uniref:Uncharacterized protein n=1 Tax=Ridgeia piscesae TaxID=27915 RepID=A0AAD9L3Y1_RIDPI|nr:hypothetical protein NP493_335g04011 [Ridgeia piscesae]